MQIGLLIQIAALSMLHDHGLGDGSAGTLWNPMYLRNKIFICQMR